MTDDTPKIEKGMAHYWTAVHSGKHYLCCQTSEGDLLRASAKRVIKAVQSGEFLTLKPWRFSQSNGEGEEEEEEQQRKRKRTEAMGKEKTPVAVQPAPKKRKIDPSVGPLRALPELPPEILLEIMKHWKEPTPAVRRVIFPLLMGSRVNIFSRYLAKSSTVWEWYQDVLGYPPDKGLANLVHYYKGYDPNAFARQWYSGFVNSYDLKKLWKIYETPQDVVELEQFYKNMNNVLLHTIKTHLRGRTVGLGGTFNISFFQEMEMEIQQVLDELNIKAGWLRPDRLVDSALTIAMLNVGQLWGMGVHQNTYLETFQKHDEKWMEKNWLGTPTNQFIFDVINPIQDMSKAAIRFIRNRPFRERFTARDITALVWLINLSMALAKPAGEYAEANYLTVLQEDPENDFTIAFMGRLRDQLRWHTLTEEEREEEEFFPLEMKENELMEREMFWGSEAHDREKRWVRKWGPKKKSTPKGEGPSVPPPPPLLTPEEEKEKEERRRLFERELEMEEEEEEERRRKKLKSEERRRRERRRRIFGGEEEEEEEEGGESSSVMEIGSTNDQRRRPTRPTTPKNLDDSAPLPVQTFDLAMEEEENDVDVFSLESDDHQWILDLLETHSNSIVSSSVLSQAYGDIFKNIGAESRELQRIRSNVVVIKNLDRQVNDSKLRQSDIKKRITNQDLRRGGLIGAMRGVDITPQKRKDAEKALKKFDRTIKFYKKAIDAERLHRKGLKERIKRLQAENRRLRDQIRKRPRKRAAQRLPDKKAVAMVVDRDDDGAATDDEKERDDNEENNREIVFWS